MPEMIKNTLRLVSMLTLFSSSSFVFAERYSVEQDGFGNYSAKKVESATSDSVLSDYIESPAISEALPLASEEKSVQTVEESQLNIHQEELNLEFSDNAAPPEKEAPRKIGKFERVYLEAEKAERQRVLDAIKNNANANGYDATQVNPDDFVDSETGLRPGETLNEANSPYYISIDAEGNKQIIYYDPEEVREILFQERNPKIVFTESTVYDEASSEINVPKNADPVALNFLNPVDKKFEGYFKTFSEFCCSQLPSISIPEMKVGESYFFSLTSDDLAYRFNEGNSRFIIVQLPYLGKEKIPLRLKSFIRRHGDQGIENGVFFPQVVTLDKDKQPLRIMVGPLLKFQEETWTTHAFLQGIFPITQTAEHDERFVLINTTKEALRTPSIIDIPASEDDSATTIKLTHMDIGSVQLEILQ